jgi:cell division protein FtsN
MAKPSRTSSRSNPPKHSKQSGGTFLGIVLGLIVGLAIAVIVALYITRAPTPFVAKVGPNGASDTGVVDQQYDPNRSLQGKTPGQAVPQAAQPASGAAQPQGLLPVPQIVEVPASAPPSVGNASEPAPAQAPAAQQQPSRPPQVANVQPPAAATPGASTPGHANAEASGADANTGYFLQVGAYKTAADAEQQRARLAFQGFESKVSERDAGGVTYFRVRIGPFSKFDDMNTARQRLSDAGIDTSVIRFAKQ